MSLASAVQRGFFPVAILLAVCAIGVVGFVLGPVTALRGMYVLVGVSVGALVYYAGRWIDTTASGTETSTANRYLKAILFVVFLGLALATSVGARRAILLVVLPAGYGLLFLHMRTSHSPQRSVVAAFLLFTLNALSKYLTTGFYFSRGDTLLTVSYVRRVLETGSSASIDSLYQFFPGVHFLSSTVALATDLPAYDSFFLIGILTYAGLIPLVFVLANCVTAADHAAAVAVAFSVLEPTHLFATYFFPEAFAVPLLFFALFAVVRGGTDTSPRIALLSLVFVASAVITHHLTIILVIPLLVWLSVIAELNPYEKLPSRRLIVVSITLVFAAIGYWSFTGWAWWFFVALGRAVVELPNPLSLLSGGGGGGIYAFGTMPPESQGPIELLTYPPFLYFSLLASVFSLGVISIFERPHRSLGHAGFLTGGILSAVLLFELPIPLPAVGRIGLPYAIVFTFVVGFGLFRLQRTSLDIPLGNLFLVALFLTFAVSGAIATADDVNKLSDKKQMQTSFSSEEYRAITSSSSFVDRHSRQTTTLWATRLAYRGQGVNTGARVNISADGIRAPDGVFIYREAWPQHNVRYKQDAYGLRTFAISKSYLSDAITRENRVYSTGTVGGLWQDRSGYIGHQP